jgi:hypothetical protein
MCGFSNFCIHQKLYSDVVLKKLNMNYTVDVFVSVFDAESFELQFLLFNQSIIFLAAKRNACIG